MFFLGEQEGLGKPLLIIYIDIDKKSEVQYRVKLDNEGEEKKKEELKTNYQNCSSH